MLAHGAIPLDGTGLFLAFPVSAGAILRLPSGDDMRWVNQFYIDVRVFKQGSAGAYVPLEPDIEPIMKRFTVEQLARRVRAVNGAPYAGVANGLNPLSR